MGVWGLDDGDSGEYPDDLGLDVGGLGLDACGFG